MYTPQIQPLAAGGRGDNTVLPATCHPTQVNAPRLTPACRLADTRLSYPGGMEGWVGWFGYIPRWFTRLSADSHPSKY